MRITTQIILRSALTGLLAAAATGAHAQTADFLGGQAGNTPVVTGAPYSGEGITTVKARMFDGTRIERTVSAKFYRDSAGRVRREQTVVGLESLDPSGDFRAVVTIFDPVAGVIITLNPASRTAHRLAISTVAHADRLGRALADAGGRTAATPRVETLGTRDIDGISAVGHRSVITIPIGQAGNDRPIEISDERWESPELKVLLQSIHRDPRSGDIEFRLKKVSRAEPSKDLFTVPAGYTIMDLS